MKNLFIKALLFLLILLNSNIFAEEVYNDNSIDIQAVEATQSTKYPDYAKMYTGDDKHEKFNRKMFNLNMKLNKYIAKPVHIIWSSIMPKFGIDRIRDAYNNIEYPKRAVSCIVQRDGKALKQETLRFITNSTIGLGGLFDPADKIFKIKPTNENMEQALCKCKMASGSYLVMPCLNSCTPRSLCGRTLEAALDPTVYIATPISTIVKFGLMLNRTSYMQPLAHMIETTYADPYDIHKKLYGIENYIKNSNYDREDLLREEKELVAEGRSDAAEEIISQLGENSVNSYQEFNIDNIQKNNSAPNNNKFNCITGQASDLTNILPLTASLKPDIILDGFNVQTPIVDSMKTAFFEDKSVDKSIWNEISLWNRSFSRRIKTGSIVVNENREPYKYKYILQKDKQSPLAILYPSIGEGSGCHHSVVFAKMFYDKGYSVVMQGSHFHWEFVKSMPEGFAPGNPSTDSEYVRLVSAKIIDDLKEKYNYEPKEKIVLGTSFGAIATLFVANEENKNNILGVSRYVAVSPPIELNYAIKQLDKNSEEFDNNSPEVKDKTALTAAKILQLYDIKDDKNFKPGKLPFTDEEGKMITTFILRQKLSDIIYTIEGVNKNKESEIYNIINNMSYQDYAEKYLGLNINNFTEKENINISLYSLSDYFKNNNNYKIYESFDDYFINKDQIKKLKELAGKNLICINCGAHLGFLYRKEFIEDLKHILFET